MTDELCIPKFHFSSLIISDLILLCSSTFFNPLYISYFIFFSPYLLRPIIFLYPLLFTTFLISLTGIDSALTSPVLENDHPDDLGIYEILFGVCSTNCLNEETPLEDPHEKSEENPEPVLDDKGSSFCKINDANKKMEAKNPGPVSEFKNSCPVFEERRLENFLKILDHFEKMSSGNVDGKRKNGGKFGQADVVRGVRQNASTKIDKAHSERIISSSNVEKEHNLKFESFRRWDRNNNSASFGSMRKEKEWKRTLACKLFEERHNVDGGEGMDSLWEAYETDSNKPKREMVGMKERGDKSKREMVGMKERGDKSKREMVGMKERGDKSIREMGEMKKRGKNTSITEFSEELCGDEDEDEVVDGKLCCLSAIKFSGGRVNLGMGKPNIVKISKAIKGFGWLHHVSKFSKKVHNNGDR